VRAQQQQPQQQQQQQQQQQRRGRAVAALSQARQSRVRNPAVVYPKPSDAWRQGEPSGYASPPHSRAHPLRRSLGAPGTATAAASSSFGHVQAPPHVASCCQHPFCLLQTLTVLWLHSLMRTDGWWMRWLPNEPVIGYKNSQCSPCATLEM
jgi:hypothetical protein